MGSPASEPASHNIGQHLLPSRKHTHNTNGKERERGGKEGEERESERRERERERKRQCIVYLLKTVHDHFPELFVFVLQVFNHTTHNLSPAHFVGNLNGGVHQLQ